MNSKIADTLKHRGGLRHRKEIFKPYLGAISKGLISIPTIQKTTVALASMRKMIVLWKPELR